MRMTVEVLMAASEVCQWWGRDCAYEVWSGAGVYKLCPEGRYVCSPRSAGGQESHLRSDGGGYQQSRGKLRFPTVPYAQLFAVALGLVDMLLIRVNAQIPRNELPNELVQIHGSVCRTTFPSALELLRSVNDTIIWVGTSQFSCTVATFCTLYGTDGLSSASTSHSWATYGQLQCLDSIVQADVDAGDCI